MKKEVFESYLRQNKDTSKGEKGSFYVRFCIVDKVLRRVDIGLGTKDKEEALIRAKIAWCSLTACGLVVFLKSKKIYWQNQKDDMVPHGEVGRAVKELPIFRQVPPRSEVEKGKQPE